MGLHFHIASISVQFFYMHTVIENWQLTTISITVYTNPESAKSEGSGSGSSPNVTP